MPRLFRRPPPSFADPLAQSDVVLCGSEARAFRFREGVAGRRSAVVCIAGMGANGRSFVRQAPLAAEWPLHLLNTPYETPDDREPVEFAADAVEEYLDAERLEQPVLLASSFGGAVAATVALRRRHAIAGLVLVDAVVSRAQIPLAFPGFVDLLQAPDRLARWVSPLAVQIMGGLRLDRLARDEIVREARVFSTRELKRRLEALLALHLLPALADLALPALCVNGASDLLMPWRRGAALAETLGAVFVCIRGAGHLPYLSHAPVFNAAVARFLRSYLT